MPLTPFHTYGAARKKSALEHGLDDLRREVKTAQQQLSAQTSDRLQKLEIGKRLKGLETELRKREEGAFLEQMCFGVEAMAAFDTERMDTKIMRHFIIEVK
jgi:hypothetical protein